MEKTRVKEGGLYFFIRANNYLDFTTDYANDIRSETNDADFEKGNYFLTNDDAVSAIMKLRAVLKGADVIEWHKVSEELPLVDTEVVCKMKGVPHTEHFICKWDGEFWWHWDYLGEKAQGWFGLNKGWEVTEWKKI